MPKYLVQASYTAEGTRGLLKDGGTKRRAVVDGLMLRKAHLDRDDDNIAEMQKVG